MHAIVSLLDEHHSGLVEALWRELETDCGLAGVSLTPLPHFSYHIATEFDFKRLETALGELAARTLPFTVHASGLGLFTGPSPVLYVSLIKDARLASFHQTVWELVNPVAIGASSHYTPEVWVPHITLAYGDVSTDKLDCAMNKLAFRTYNWEIRVDHLALVYQLSGQVGRLQSKFPFMDGD
jgi:2'-5' RNA ligase